MTPGDTVITPEGKTILQILDSCSQKRGANSFHHAHNMCSYGMVLEIVTEAMHRYAKQESELKVKEEKK